MQQDSKPDTKLDAKIPGGPLAEKWDRHRFELKLVNPANKRKFEIIVIDNGSTDDTAARCNAFSQRTQHFNYRYEQAPGLHIARHLGMRLAKGDVLVYTDDDIQARSSWLASIRASFQDHRVGLVGGKIEPDYESEPPPWVLSMWRRTRYGTMLPQYSVLDFGDAGHVSATGSDCVVAHPATRSANKSDLVV